MDRLNHRHEMVALRQMVRRLHMPEPMPELSHVHEEIAFKASACNRPTAHCHATLNPSS